MVVTSHNSGPITVLTLAGRFDRYTSPRVDELLEATIGAAPPYVVVDLAGVDFVDSTALATLVRGMRHCRERKGDLHLCGLQQQVYMVFDLTRLSKTFSIFVDSAHAAQSFVR